MLIYNMIENEKGLVLGFTGTRMGLTMKQRRTLEEFTRQNKIHVLHHGDCIGSDHAMHEIVRRIQPLALITIHPPSIARMRAYCDADTLRPELPYLQRNKNIVDNCDILIACPRENLATPRSGTWSAVRYAQKIGRKLFIIAPNGNPNLT
jgi:hypothetical protein